MCLEMGYLIPSSSHPLVEIYSYCQWFAHHLSPFVFQYHMAVCQNLVPLVNIKIAGKWMFIPLKMVLLGIDPYPHLFTVHRFSSFSCGHFMPCFEEAPETVELSEDSEEMKAELASRR